MTFDSGPSLETATNAVQIVDGEITHELGVIDAVAAELTARQLEALRRTAGILRIYGNGTIETAGKPVKDNPGDSRYALSKKLCQAWNWVQPNGHLRDMVCRGLMLALHRANHIRLPDRRHTPPNPLIRRSQPATIDVDRSPVQGSLKTLGPLRFEQVRRTPREPLFNSLLQQHHYLGYTRPVGEHLKYLVKADGDPVACFCWTSAPRRS